MSDAYDELRRDWCDEGDLPRATCAHCGAHPGGPSLPPLDRPWRFDGQGVTRRSGRDVFVAIELAEPPSRRLPNLDVEKTPKATCTYSVDRGWCTAEHLRDCDDHECRGCRPCSEDHCEINGCAHHVAHAAGIYTCPRCIGKARRKVRAILDLYALADQDLDTRDGIGPLLEQAAESGAESEAFNLVGPAADPGQYGEKRNRLRALYERRGWCDWPRHDGFRDDDPHHPYAVLGRWDMAIRESYGPDTDLFITVSSAAAYLSGPVLDRFAHTREFEDFLSEIGDCLRHLEDVMHDGVRPEKGAPCPTCRDHGVKPQRLVKRYAVHPGLPPGGRCAAAECRICDGKDDTWHCPTNPAHWWGEVDYRLRVDGDYVQHATALTAAQIHEVYGIKPGVLRKRAERNPKIRRGRNAQGQMLYDVALARRAGEAAGATGDGMSR